MSSEASPEELIGKIDGEAFAEWYDEREFARNIREGRPYFNGPPRVPDPERHSPSKLLQCHRKVVYRQENAPAEQETPEGIFWTGSRLEEDVVEPFLIDLVGEDEYVRNTMWVDSTIDTVAGEVRIKGATDPVIVDPESRPLLVTEVKSKKDLDHVRRPNRHHRAQVHAYMNGLSDKYDREVRDAVMIYLSRTTMSMMVFHEPFDPDFWEQVVGWAADHTIYRQDGVLPPGDPEMGWECGVCEFQHRCGESSLPFSDVGPTGFLPFFDGYPRDQVIEYLEAHQDDDVKLTPTLANRYPGLAGRYGASDWECPSCDLRFSWDQIEVNEGADEPPLCPNCVSNSELSHLTSPSL